MTDISVSIIICTRNRARSLQQTLAALGKARIPLGCVAELIVVDNASTDDTASVVANFILDSVRVVHLFEPKKGKSNSLNSALALARGEILIFTDDDVAPSEDWIEQILLCFDDSECDALVGKVKLAPDLERPWMKYLNKCYLAVNDFESGEPLHWVGANAAFHRRCLQRVRWFDPELGPGALGLAEDTLFGCQLMEAGYKMEYARRAIVVHQPDKSRLTRGAWLHAAWLHAKCDAYVLHHWQHAKIRAAKIKLLWFQAKLKLRRLFQPPLPLEREGCLDWELSYVYHLALCEYFSIERRRPRNYSRRGLSKLSVLNRPADIPVVQTPRDDWSEHARV
jgi:glycosyltransferase involved in cell wall biosynthesis